MKKRKSQKNFERNSILGICLILMISLIFANLVPNTLSPFDQKASATGTALTYYKTSRGCEHPFIDILDHWAEEEICFLYDQSVVQGHSERNYMPSSDITRAEFLKISLLNLGYVVYPVQSASFNDVNAGDWYYRYATFARSKGFISGYGDGNFLPNENITRAEAVVMIMGITEVTGYDVSGTINRYSDVSTDDWFAEAVAMATEEGIIEGYGDASFRPEDNLNRAEAAVIAHRTWNYLNYDETNELY